MTRRRRGSRVEAGAVIDDLQPDATLGPRDDDRKSIWPAMALCIPDRFLGDPPDQGDDLRRDVRSLGNLNLDVDARGDARGNQVVDRRGQSLSLQFGWVDLDE